MSPRTAVTVALALVALVPARATADGAPAEPAPAVRPNVLLYVVDTLRADALRSYGRAGAKTPNADALGHEGTQFLDAHAPSAWTRASIGSILTGLYPDVHGAERRGDALPDGASLLSELLRVHGYRTGAIVTNPNVGSFFGFAQGFDDFIELYERREAGYVTSRESTTPSDEVTRRAIEWIDGAPRPFLLFVLTIDPHWPYEPPVATESERRSNARFVVRFAEEPDRLDADERARARRLYDDEVEFNDASLGRLLDHLRAKGIYDDTIVVYTADHGEEFWEHGATQHGKTLYEEMTRVPLVVRYPRAVPMAVRSDAPAELIDVAPTILALAGVESAQTFDGAPLTRPRDARARYARLELDGRRVRALTRPPWKLVWNVETDERALFNLEMDPRELWNLAARHPQRTRALLEELRALEAANGRRAAELRGGDAAPVREHDLPEPARKALEALGYLE